MIQSTSNLGVNSFNNSLYHSLQTKSFLTDIIIQVSNQSLDQLDQDWQNASFQFEEDQEWVFLPLNLEEMIKKENEILNVVKSFANLEEQEWDLLQEEMSVLQEQWEFIEKEEAAEKGWSKEWLITGGMPLAGASLGTIQQLCGSSAGRSFLQGINLLKQIEIKNCAYILPALPLFIDLAEKVYQDESSDGFTTKVAHAIKSIDKKQLAFLALSCGIGLASAGTHQFLMKAGLMAFDLSGHVMTKAVGSAMLANGLSSNERKEPSQAKKVASRLYAASDALMLHKTALSYHTPQETIAGAVWGLINVGIAQVLTSYVCSPSTVPVLKIEEELQEEEKTEPVKVNWHVKQPLSQLIVEDYLDKI
jgi:hypothetical protein